MSLQGAVDEYKKKFSEDEDEYNKSVWFFRKYCDEFRSINNIECAIKRSVLSIDNYGKMYPHQWWVGGRVLSAFMPYVLNARDEIEGAQDFDSLYNIIWNLRAKFKLDGESGIGELCVYDFAFRICCYLDKKKGGMLPNSVYLHAGPRKGAKILGLGFRRKALSVDEFPSEIISSQLSPAEIENFLCLYHNRMQKLS